MSERCWIAVDSGDSENVLAVGPEGFCATVAERTPGVVVREIGPPTGEDWVWDSADSCWHLKRAVA